MLLDIFFVNLNLCIIFHSLYMIDNHVLNVQKLLQYIYEYEADNINP